MTVVLLMTTTVYADELTFYYENETENVTYPQGALKIDTFESEKSDNQIFSLKSTQIPDFETYIKQNLKNHIAEIDVSMYNMKVGNFIAKVSEYCDELMVATGIISSDEKEKDESIPKIDRTITKWRPVYLFSTQQEDVRARAFVKQEVLKYANDARALTDDPLGQLLLTHDMLVENCEYDVDCIDKIDENDDIQSYSAYGFFKNKKAVCQGYSEAFYLIAEELGYDCGFNVSFQIGHIWNYIKVDNEFYQVDMTWNDPTYGEEVNKDGSITVKYHTTLASHKYFLCSDALMSIGHGEKKTWYQSMDTKPDCGTKFEEGYLFNIYDNRYIVNDNIFISLGAYTTKFVDGRYVVKTNVLGKGNVVLPNTYKTDSLYTGPVISSVINKNDTGYYFDYYFTKKLSGLDMYLGQYSEDMLLQGNKMMTITDVFDKGESFRMGVSDSRFVSGFDNFKIFMWKSKSDETVSETYVPLSKPVSLI